MAELIYGGTGVWFMIGALLVFFMQCGFAMVETGFTRAKNAGNIIMKNLMDFCIGTVVFSLLGFGLMMSEDYVAGFIGVPNLNMFTNWMNFDWNSFVFQLVFCATAATIVSGAMAERTKFSAYCVYSAIISLVVYPIEAGWVWNGQGWLAQLGCIDFAGSIVIHMVGGISALVGAIILGPRIGKYGKNGKVNAIPGHSITLGALGVFILWFAWYGFNGAAAEDGARLGQILLTTTIAPAVATVTTMLFTWIKNGKPDVSMCLNASLAGLVAITAGCADVDAIGAAVIGLVSGILIVVAVEFVDIKLKIDDPVGAFSVHGVNGMWGGLAVGLFATGNGQNGITGMTVSQVLGCGAQKGKAEYYRGVAIESNLLPKMKVEIVVCKVPVKAVVDAAVKALYTGHIGDGKIFIYDVEDVVKVRTGETGYDAMQDIE